MIDPAGVGNPGSTRDDDKKGLWTKDEVANSTIVLTDLFRSLTKVSCLSLGPPSSRILTEFSGSIPIDLRKALTACCVPFDLMISGRFTRVLRNNSCWMCLSELVFEPTSSSTFSARMNCSNVELL